MGILGLSKLLNEKAPGAGRVDEMKNFFGRKLAIDASMCVYQVMISLRDFDDSGNATDLTNDKGEITSHLNGVWARCLKLIDAGIKPIYVFDGAPPDLKRKELDKRNEKAADAQALLEAAKEENNTEEMARQAKRSVRVSKEQMQEVKTMLQLMGIPCVQAPSEAEAQCVELVKKGKAYAVATEDMDALTFGAPVLIRNLHAADQKKKPLTEYRISDVLKRLGAPWNMNSFIDLCILLGCDYIPSVRGIGPVKAFDGLKEHQTMEAFLASLDQNKYSVPPDFDFVAARELFTKPPITPAEELTLEWKEPMVDELKDFMVKDKLFDPNRIDKGIERLRRALQKKTQGRLDAFFGAATCAAAVPRPAALPSTSASNKKRPPESQQHGKATAASPTQAGAGEPAAKAHRVGNGPGGHKKAVQK